MGVDRKALRTAVQAKLAIAIPTAVVTKSLPKKLAGRSPVITVESNGTRPNPYDTPEGLSMVGLLFGIFIRREDADVAEDLLDDTLDALIDALNEDFNVTWPEDSKPDYEVDEGLVYRIEWIEGSFQW